MPEEQLIVRPIMAGEETSVIELWRMAGLTRPWNDANADIGFAKCNSNSDILVGIAGGGPIACVMVGHDGHRGAMYYVAVHPSYRGRGYGKQIVDAAERWLLDRGVWKVNLLVRQGSEEVLGFYRRLGYALGATLPIEKWIDPSKRGDAVKTRAQ